MLNINANLAIESSAKLVAMTEHLVHSTEFLIVRQRLFPVYLDIGLTIFLIRQYSRISGALRMNVSE